MHLVVKIVLAIWSHDCDSVISVKFCLVEMLSKVNAPVHYMDIKTCWCRLSRTWCCLIIFTRLSSQSSIISRSCMHFFLLFFFFFQWKLVCSLLSWLIHCRVNQGPRGKQTLRIYVLLQYELKSYHIAAASCNMPLWISTDGIYSTYRAGLCTSVQPDLATSSRWNLAKGLNNELVRLDF